MFDLGFFGVFLIGCYSLLDIFKILFIYFFVRELVARVGLFCIESGCFFCFLFCYCLW